ncbi:hypothetical protein DFH08DRAFT_808061 [Mycena albidolilacea]|uniref:Uncharacterized protein n=1 Tax=Mycena albidolilacea TaxID=1033008 RepID=A0AAD7ERE4_9AGAR|nr:hypothetical protein DFH08DRAFT_808061 [Mycena albidolilacea]
MSVAEDGGLHGHILIDRRTRVQSLLSHLCEIQCRGCRQAQCLVGVVAEYGERDSDGHYNVCALIEPLGKRLEIDILKKFGGGIRKRQYTSVHRFCAAQACTSRRRPPLPTGVIVGVSVAVAGVVFILALVFFLLRARRRHQNDADMVSPFVRVGSETPEGSLPSNSPRRHAKERLHYLEAELSTAHANIQDPSARARAHAPEAGPEEGCSEGGNGHPNLADGVGVHHAPEADGEISTLRMRVNRLEAEIREARALDGPPAYTAG